MYIKEVYLKNFRNYKEEKIFLEEGINLFFGNNAQGKTNIIESIFLSSMGKSFRARKEKELIYFEEKEAIIETKFEKKDRKGKIKYIIEESGKKIYVNDISLKKTSEILGNINIVLFSPEDINIIKDGPANRRKFINMLISQVRPNYVYLYNLYYKILEQRNSFLKKTSIEKINIELLDIYDEKLAENAQKIYEYREEFINKIKEKINKIHNCVTEGKENIKIKYISECSDKEEFLEKLKNNRKNDLEKGYTTAGIHRDDIYFFINGKKIDVFGSQGQQRTTVLTLKQAELEVIKEEIGENPILLLDDFMSELDNKRKINFLKGIKNTQIIITCTEDFKIEDIQMNKFFIEEGKIIKKQKT